MRSEILVHLNKIPREYSDNFCTFTFTTANNFFIYKNIGMKTRCIKWKIQSALTVMGANKVFIQLIRSQVKVCNLALSIFHQ